MSLLRLIGEHDQRLAIGEAVSDRPPLSLERQHRRRYQGDVVQVDG